MSIPIGLDLARLLGHLEVRLALHPRYADWRNLRGLARAYTGQEAGAREDFAAALTLNPHYAAALANLAWLDASCGIQPREDAGLSPEWRAHLQCVADMHRGETPRLESLPDSSPWRLLDTLWFAVQRQDWLAVESARSRAVAGVTGLHAILQRLGLGAAADHTAWSTWASLYRGNPQAISLCHAAAEIARADEDLDRSASLLAWGAAISLDLCAYGMALSAHLDAAGRESEAQRALEDAVTADPNRAVAHAALGYRHAANGRLEAAIGAMERAAALAPRFADLRYELGLLYRDAGREADAVRELRAALAAQPDYVLAHLALGTLLQECGRDAEALPYLQRVRRAGLRSAEVEMRLAAAHAQLGHVNHARRAAARARAVARVTRASTAPYISPSPTPHKK